MVRVLKELVERESPTSDKRAVDGCLDYFLGHVSKLPVDVLRFPQREIGDLCLVGYPGLSRFEAKPILVLAHTDTVWPVGQLKTMPWRTAGPKVFGPGVLDMKAGLVVALYALKALASLRIPTKRPVLLFINSAEETGHPAASRMIEQLSRKSAFVLCLEPALPGGALKVQRKGRLVVNVRARGKSAHAGTPQNGVSAVEELLLQLNGLRGLRTRGTTMNIGLISGGTKPNVVPADAGAVLDFRFWTEKEAKVILGRLKKMSPKVPGARLSCAVESMTPPLERNAASRRLFQRATKIAGGLGLRLKAGKTGGGSDASLAASLGLPALDGLGPDGAGIHAANEHILVPSFLERAAFLAALLAGLD
jgi:glutamate carboxypeptidase